jgi:hypothetical protein
MTVLANRQAGRRVAEASEVSELEVRNQLGEIDETTRRDHG